MNVIWRCEATKTLVAQSLDVVKSYNMVREASYIAADLPFKSCSSAKVVGDVIHLTGETKLIRFTNASTRHWS